MNILVYHRPIHKQFYELMAAEYFPEFKMITLSDFKKSANIWLGEKNIENSKDECNIFSIKEKKDILLRCRFLRSIDEKAAIKLINNMSSKLDEIIKIYNPKYIFGPLIDNYTMDIMERLAIKSKIPYVSFLGHFFTGYSWISRRGELNHMPREIDDSEVENILDEILNNKYIPSYHRNINTNINKEYSFFIKQMLKKYLYLPIRKRYEKDKWNYYYNTYFFRESNPLRINDFVSNSIELYFSRNSEVDYSRKNVLLPLHLTPEATTDYWCDNPNCGSNYEDSVIDVIMKSTKNVNFLVKEHPAMYMKRQKQFYKRLLEFSNVKLIHPFDSSNETLEKVDIVYVYTGSIGIEALIRNKMVISNSNIYYSDLHPNVYISNFISDEHLETTLQPSDNYKFIKDILRGTMKGTMYNNNHIMDSDKEIIFKQVRDYCNMLGSK